MPPTPSQSGTGADARAKGVWLQSLPLHWLHPFTLLLELTQGVLWAWRPAQTSRGGRVGVGPGAPGWVSGLKTCFPWAQALSSRSLQLGKAYGVESHVLSPAETKDLYPLMNVDDLYGTLYVPQDGTMDPAGTCTTLTRAAVARGAKVPITTNSESLL